MKCTCNCVGGSDDTGIGYRVSAISGIRRYRVLDDTQTVSYMILRLEILNDNQEKDYAIISSFSCGPMAMLAVLSTPLTALCE